MQKIVPHLWFDHQGREAIEFYASVWPNSKLLHTTTLHDTPSGDADIFTFTLFGQEFMAINGGPHFKLNPAISFMVNFDPSLEKDAAKNIDVVWNKLVDGGKILMPLDAYPFSKRYGWVEDKYGVSWQLILTDPEGDERPLIIPSLLFVGNVYGKAKEAGEFYTSVFKTSKLGAAVPYGPGHEPDKADALMFSEFKLEDMWFVAMDSALQHDFAFNEAISFIVNCDTQEEIDYFWEKLSADPAAEQCGWLKDKFGVSWQIQPARINDMMTNGAPEQIDRVTQALLPMKKLDLAVLEKAYKG